MKLESNMKFNFLTILCFFILSGSIQVIAQKSNSYLDNIELLVRAARAKLILEKTGPETTKLINRLKAALPVLRKQVKPALAINRKVKRAEEVLWQVEAEIQAYYIIKRESFDPSRELIRKQMLWEKLLRSFLALENEAKKNLLSLVFFEGKAYTADLMEEVSKLDLSNKEEEGLQFIKYSFNSWREKSEKIQEDIEREAQEKIQGYPFAPVLKRQNAITRPPRRPESIHKGYVPEK